MAQENTRVSSYYSRSSLEEATGLFEKQAEEEYLAVEEAMDADLGEQRNNIVKSIRQRK